MKLVSTFALALAMTALSTTGAAAAQEAPVDGVPGPEQDPYIFLEEARSPEALDWVGKENERTLAAFEADPRYAQLKAEALAIFDSNDRIPFVSFRPDGLYNFWQDKTNPKGVLRPNQYVKVRMKGAIRPNAILVPQRSVQQGSKYDFLELKTYKQWKPVDGEGTSKKLKEGVEWSFELISNAIDNTGLPSALQQLTFVQDLVQQMQFARFTAMLELLQSLREALMMKKTQRQQPSKHNLLSHVQQ